MRALVTGGGGFLGGAIVRQLVDAGHEVRSYARGAYPGLARAGVEVVQGDLCDVDAVTAAARGCDIVFHVAARPGVWGTYASFHRPNVIGTRNVLHACRAAGVGRLVHTSSPSVVFHGGDMEGATEATPYPSRFHAHYPRTKAIAEREVLGASDANLATVALRPHLIWGPDDNHLVPRIVARGRKGQLRRIGSQSKLVDSVYVDNAARAHLQAAERLAPGTALAGKAYFISNGEPMPVWDLIDGILAAAGLPSVRRSIPRGLAMAAASVMEVIHTFLPVLGEPRLTRFVVAELTSAHWFDISAARRDLGYEPGVTIAEGLERLKAWFQERDRVS